MLIRSQSKTSLVNMDRVNLIYIAGGNTIQAFYSENDSDTLGIYSTEEKAIKVLDMIQDKYASYMSLQGGQMLTQDLFVNPNYWVLPKVFEMPADEEVEV